MSEKVLCASCKKPIKLNEVGIITKGKFYHNRLFCLMIYLETKKQAGNSNIGVIEKSITKIQAGEGK